jgi:Flp pilus assembly protein TadG
MRSLTRSRSAQKGQSLVELALSMTVMLILLGGIVDLGRAFFTFMALRDAVQEGAMYGSLHPTSTVEIKNQVRDSSSLVSNMISTRRYHRRAVGHSLHGEPDPGNGGLQ